MTKTAASRRGSNEPWPCRCSFTKVRSRVYYLVKLMLLDVHCCDAINTSSCYGLALHASQLHLTKAQQGCRIVISIMLAADAGGCPVLAMQQVQDAYQCDSARLCVRVTGKTFCPHWRCLRMIKRRTCGCCASWGPAHCPAPAAGGWPAEAQVPEVLPTARSACSAPAAGGRPAEGQVLILATTCHTSTREHRAELAHTDTARTQSH